LVVGKGCIKLLFCKASTEGCDDQEFKAAPDPFFPSSCSHHAICHGLSGFCVGKEDHDGRVEGVFYFVFSKFRLS
jgi:hypothetical protein